MNFISILPSFVDARLAGRYSDFAEVLHYPYSTDPGSPLARDPASFGMRCSLGRAADYERALGSQEPWLGNLLGHEPDTGRPGDWRAASLGIELEQACLRQEPGLHASLQARLGGRIDRFFLTLARRLLRERDPSTLDRNALAGILRSEALTDPPR